jgi:hypothetical protein
MTGRQCDGPENIDRRSKTLCRSMAHGVSRAFENINRIKIDGYQTAQSAALNSRLNPSQLKQVFGIEMVKRDYGVPFELDRYANELQNVPIQYPTTADAVRSASAERGLDCDSVGGAGVCRSSARVNFIHRRGTRDRTGDLVGQFVGFFHWRAKTQDISRRFGGLRLRHLDTFNYLK